TATLYITPPQTAGQGNYPLAITGIGGTNPVQSDSVSYVLTVTQGFTFDVSLIGSSSGTAVRGSGTPVIISTNIVLTSGASHAVTLAADVGSSGVSVSFAGGDPTCTPAPPTNSCQKQIMLTAPAGAALYPDPMDPTSTTLPVQVYGTYGSQTKPQPPITYNLAVIDSFTFNLSASPAVPPSINAGDFSDAIITANNIGGGQGWEDIALSYSVSPPSADLTVSFGAAMIRDDMSTLPMTNQAHITTLGTIQPDNYVIVIIGTYNGPSGSVIRSATVPLVVGTTLSFSLSSVPDSERIGTKPGASAGPVTITALNESPEDQPSASPIAFTIGDTADYRLPADVTVCVNNISSCGDEAWFAAQAVGCVTPLPPQNGQTCQSPPLYFTIGANAIDGTYNIPIVGTSGGATVQVKQLMQYTLKVGLLTLTQFPLPQQPPQFATDPHQRPQFSLPPVAWDPPAVFAGDWVTFTSSPTVYEAGQGGTNAATPATASNASACVNYAPVGTAVGACVPTSFNTAGYPRQFIGSGNFTVAMTVEDATDQCYPFSGSGGTPTNPCSCSAQLSVGGANIFEVAKPRPFFREIKP
ncbi:MAG: hypothetical protein AAB581_00280, partial [Patescibacteria group bacterium]